MKKIYLLLVILAALLTLTSFVLFIIYASSVEDETINRALTFLAITPISAMFFVEGVHLYQDIKDKS